MGPLRLGDGGRSLPVLEQRLRGVRFIGHQVASVLNPPETTGIGCWSLNPYVGCEFGCTYCYARYVHRYTIERARDAGRLDAGECSQLVSPAGWQRFEREIFIKDPVAVSLALERDLPKLSQRLARGEAAPLVIGTATDPYQPAERRFGVTRQVLERLATAPPLEIAIITKSPLVTRDIPLLARLSRRHQLAIHLSLISANPRLVRWFEARSPVPRARLRALRKLTDAGLEAGLLVAPILPGITDRASALRALLALAKAHGARFVHAGPLRLYRSVRPVFVPVLERHFPHLVPRYLAAYRRAERAPERYLRALKERFARLAATLDLPTDDRFGTAPLPPHQPAQLGLWDAMGSGAANPAQIPSVGTSALLARMPKGASTAP